MPALKPRGEVGMSEFRREIDCDELSDPAHVVSELMLHQLRETWEADIDFDKLLLEVRER